MRIGTASITRSKTATAEAIFWPATKAFVIRARTTSLDPRSKGRPGNVAVARIKTGVPSQLFSHYALRGAIIFADLIDFIASQMLRRELTVSTASERGNSFELVGE